MTSTTTTIPSHMTQAFHKKWLKVTAIVIASLAPTFFLATMDATSEPARWALDLVSWPLDGATTLDHPDTRILIAITAGLLLGWGATIWFLSGAPYDAAPEAVRRSVLYGVLAWYVLDNLGSVTSGNPSNVFFNTLILLVGVGPLWRPARD
ncbi:MAG: hypothetical protein ACFB01_11525 [Cohaesibacteraceae bacterium]